MRTTHIVWLSFGILFLSSAALADSPLTSTGFSAQYQDVDAVREAGTSGLSETVVASLTNPDTALDVVAATVNALGWQGTSRADDLLEAVAVAHGADIADLTLEELTAGEALALGYLAALDDYHNLSAIGVDGEVGAADPEQLLDRAIAAAPGARTPLLIRSLITAQASMDDSWCDVWTGVDQAAESGAHGGLRPDALTMVMDYIGLYESSCGVEATLPDPGDGVLHGH